VATDEERDDEYREEARRLIAESGAAGDCGPEEPECCCGHVRDEHSSTGECEVEMGEDGAVGGFCSCACFEEPEEDPEERYMPQGPSTDGVTSVRWPRFS
jgi:hypothetical protein